MISYLKSAKSRAVKAIIKFLANGKPVFMNCKFSGQVNLGGHGFYEANNVPYGSSSEQGNMTERQYKKHLRDVYLKSKGYDLDKVGKRGAEFIKQQIEKHKQKD